MVEFQLSHSLDESGLDLDCVDLFGDGLRGAFDGFTLERVEVNFVFGFLCVFDGDDPGVERLGISYYLFVYVDLPVLEIVEVLEDEFEDMLLEHTDNHVLTPLLLLQNIQDLAKHFGHYPLFILLGILGKHRIQSPFINNNIKLPTPITQIKHIPNLILQPIRLRLHPLLHLSNNLLAVITTHNFTFYCITELFREKTFATAYVEDPLLRMDEFLENFAEVGEGAVPLEKLLVGFAVLEFLEEVVPVLFVEELFVLFRENVHGFNKYWFIIIREREG